MKFIIKFGGSLLFNKNSDEFDISKMHELIDIIVSSKNVLGMVCGGGKIARKYIDIGRNMGLEEEKLDTLGIMVSRIHAQLFIYLMGKNAHPEPITTLEQAIKARLSKKIMVAGGLIAKQSTTTVAMQLCEVLRCNLIILTDVDGIYDSDPKLNPGAHKFDLISSAALEELLISRTDQEQIAGKYQIFDLLSLDILKRSQVEVRVIDGSDLKNLQRLLSENFRTSQIGTIIKA